jgi:hypothetical protein
MSPPTTTADKLTISDKRTIASSAGSPVSYSSNAETSSGTTGPPLAACCISAKNRQSS